MLVKILLAGWCTKLKNFPLAYFNFCVWYWTRWRLGTWKFSCFHAFFLTEPMCKRRHVWHHCSSLVHAPVAKSGARFRQDLGCSGLPVIAFPLLITDFFSLPVHLCIPGEHNVRCNSVMLMVTQLVMLRLMVTQCVMVTGWCTKLTIFTLAYFNFWVWYIIILM